MKVFFLTEGGKSIGFGHVTRCTAIQQALKEKNLASEMVVNADPTVEGMLKGVNHRYLDWLNDEQGLFDIIDHSDMVIIDSYLAEESLYYKIAGRIKTGVYLDDFKRINYPQGIVISSTIYAEDLNYQPAKGLNYLLGTRYLPLRQDFWSGEKIEIKKEIKKVLISFGGMDHFQLIRDLGKYLEVGFGFQSVCIDKHNRVSSQEFRKLMLDCDICISAGGQTTYELACCGVPAIGVCLADNQVLNLKKWQELGFLDFAGWYSDEDLFEKIEQSIKHLTYQDRVKRSCLGRSYVDGQGASRLADKLLENC